MRTFRGAACHSCSMVRAADPARNGLRISALLYWRAEPGSRTAWVGSARGRQPHRMVSIPQHSCDTVDREFPSCRQGSPYAHARHETLDGGRGTESPRLCHCDLRAGRDALRARGRESHRGDLPGEPQLRQPLRRLGRRRRHRPGGPSPYAAGRPGRDPLRLSAPERPQSRPPRSRSRQPARTPPTGSRAPSATPRSRSTPSSPRARPPARGASPAAPRGAAPATWSTASIRSSTSSTGVA